MRARPWSDHRQSEQDRRDEVEPEAPREAPGHRERLRGDLGRIEVERLAQPLDVAHDGPVARVELAGAQQRPERLAVRPASGRRLGPVPVERRALAPRPGELAVERDRAGVVAGADEVVRLAKAVLGGAGGEGRARAAAAASQQRAPRAHAHLRTASAARAARSCTLSE